MQAADDEIELVAKDVVMRVGDEVNEQARRAEPQRRRARDSRRASLADPGWRSVRLSNVTSSGVIALGSRRAKRARRAL